MLPLVHKEAINSMQGGRLPSKLHVLDNDFAVLLKMVAHPPRAFTGREAEVWIAPQARLSEALAWSARGRTCKQMEADICMGSD